jgi:hypothetical protein
MHIFKADETLPSFGESFELAVAEELLDYDAINPRLSYI